MNDHDFKPGEILEFSNDENFHPEYTVAGELLTIKKNGQYPYWRLTFDNDSTALGYRYARRPLPDIKLGHPILVFSDSSNRWWYTVFRTFSKNGNAIVRALSPGDIDIHYKKWKLLENYDYTKPPEIPPWVVIG